MKRLVVLFLLLLAPVGAEDRKAIEDYFRLVSSLNANWAQEVKTYQDAMNVQNGLTNFKRNKDLTALQETAQANLARLREATVPGSARPLAERWVAIWEMKSRLYTTGIEMVKALANVQATVDKPERRKAVDAVMRLLTSSQKQSEQVAKDATSAAKDTQTFLKDKGSDPTLFE